MHIESQTISFDLLAEALPFHLAVDHNLRVVSLGKTLQQVLPEDCIGRPLDAYLRLDSAGKGPKPQIVGCLKPSTERNIRLTIIDKNLVLRGDLFCLSHGALFSGSLHITDLAQLQAVGLRLSDLSSSDHLVDYLIARESHRLDLDDARKMAQHLRTQRDLLEETSRKLEESEKRYRSATEHVSDVIFRTDTKGYWTFLNPAWETLSGYSVEETIGQHAYLLVHPEDQAEAMAQYNAMKMRELPRSRFQVRYIRKDASVCWVEANCSPVIADDFSIEGYSGTLTDVTRRRASEDALLRSEQRFRGLFELHDSVMLLVDSATGEIVDANYAAERYYGYSRQTLQQMHITDINQLPADDVQKAVANAVNQSENSFEFPHRLANGETRWVEVHSSPIEYKERKLLFSIIHDVTLRRKAQEEQVHYAREQARQQEVERRNAELLALSRRLVEVQEEERAAIARELHDEVGQLLTGLKLCLGAAQRATGDRLNEHLRESLEITTEIMGHVRSMSLDLRPSILDDFGLTAALKWLFQRFNIQTGLEVNAVLSGIDRRFPQALETTVYRLVQEALTNVARYSGVLTAEVCICCESGNLIIEVEDLGAGFDVEEVRARTNSSGLKGMRERVRLLGGMLQISSAIGSGTEVRAMLPIPQDLQLSTPKLSTVAFAKAAPKFATLIELLPAVKEAPRKNTPKRDLLISIGPEDRDERTT